MEIVAGLAAEEADSDAGCDLPQPESKISEISAEQKKNVPWIHADERGLENCERLMIQTIKFLWSP